MLHFPVLTKQTMYSNSEKVDILRAYFLSSKNLVATRRGYEKDYPNSQIFKIMESFNPQFSTTWTNALITYKNYIRLGQKNEQIRM